MCKTREHQVQHLTRGAPDRLLGQGHAAGYVVGVRRIAELDAKRMVDHGVALGEIRHDDADTSAWLAAQTLAAPLRRRVYLLRA